jgi:hypothetical protein
MGALIAFAARFGGRELWTLGRLWRPALALLLAMAIASLVAGTAGYVFARIDAVSVDAYVAANVPSRSHDRFVADAWAHTAAYGVGVL